MTRRRALLAAGLLAPALRCFAAAVPGISLRGKLAQSHDGKPTLELNDHQLVILEADASTIAVLSDQRLWGSDFQVIGHFNDPLHFEVEPFYKRAMFVHKDGKRMSISYWCDTCSIRTYTPGNCVCCQNYTKLDLREDDEP